MSENSGVMKENCWTVVLVVVHRVCYSHFIISLKKYDMVAKTFLYIMIILCFVNKLNSSMSNFGGRLSQPKKNKLFLGISFFLPTKFNRWWIFDFETDNMYFYFLSSVCTIAGKKSGTSNFCQF
jgi:hypothetical protein